MSISNEMIKPTIDFNALAPGDMIGDDMVFLGTKKGNNIVAVIKPFTLPKDASADLSEVEGFVSRINLFPKYAKVSDAWRAADNDDISLLLSASTKNPVAFEPHLGVVDPFSCENSLGITEIFAGFNSNRGDWGGWGADERTFKCYSFANGCFKQKGLSEAKKLGKMVVFACTSL